ncbi:unnamed protein product [Brassicogethes aeneus]|uniref:DH domain-containing protein n=1 Tax=Brassicogethes aeneus TaxID=1431903 RepID=A0A9P0AR47_BRAAE|nr:unnamed protein product [Brassicogethes aeneus]
MAALVSHAMRRFPTSPPDTVYSSYGLRGEGSRKSWSPAEEGESALSRSMRYADPWLYGSVRGPGGLVLAPAFVLCTCPDYLNGTKRGSKKGTTICKKCKGTRLPLSPVESKFGTVRCYPTSHSPVVSTPLRAGTMRVSSSSRPSILPTADPYDLMRRSRLSVTESSSQFRARSISPNKARIGDGRSHSATRSKASKDISYNSTFGRRSILECDINPYELMSTDNKESSITFVNGQRIRVRPSTNEETYDDVQIKRSPSKSSSGKNKKQMHKTKIPVSTLKHIEKEPEFNSRFKSILKKPAQTFSDTDSTGPESCPSPAPRGQSQFYVQMPCTSPRKKVQFLVENEKNSLQPLPQPESPEIEEIELPEYEDDVFIEEKTKAASMLVVTKKQEEKPTPPKVCKLKRSISDRIIQDHAKVVFLDTMALRTRIPRTDARITFNEKDLERLDGLSSKTRKIISFTPRPSDPPPPPPQTTDLDEYEDVSIIEFVKEEQHEKCDTKIVNDDNFKTTNETPINNYESMNFSSIKNSNFKEKYPEVKFEKKVDSVKNILEDLSPPSAPPRKRSNNKQPQINIVSSPTVQTLKVELPITSPISYNDYYNKTVVQINATPAVHKLQIKNEFEDTCNNIQTVSVLDNAQRKTSILINGDDCYSTVNVNDNVPLYQSSVVVKDSGIDVLSSPSKKSSSVYITGSFVPSSPLTNEIKIEQNIKVVEDIIREVLSKEQNLMNKEISNDLLGDVVSKNDDLVESFNENNIPSSELLKELLRDPVEAVRRNLVPHVCGKSDVSRRQRDTKFKNLPLYKKTDSLLESPLEECPLENIEDSFLRLKNYESIADDLCSEHSSSTQYELMDPGSDCYTDHSNRSSVTEEELANRTKFYELLADAALIEVSENEDHHYESIKVNTDPIYEEIEIPPPLPTNPPPTSLIDDLQLDKEFTTRSIFEGASKYDILSYLVDAKDRVQEDNYSYSYSSNGTSHDDDTKEPYNRASHMSTVSDSSEDNSLIMSGAIIDEKATYQKPAEVERNDSGVGSETSKSSLSKYRIKQEPSIICEDCDTVIELKAENDPLICRKCIKKRTERKEIITEIVETEEKYSRDLQIILEEFYQPMLVAGLLTPDQLSAIFLNAEELLENSQALAERLRDAVEIALEQGDDDLLTVNIGKLFLEAAPMLHAFETYCVRQGAASLLLASLEKDKELLRIFLRVSQMENTLLRRMNLNSFLMVPVQRVTKYPLLLARLYKVSPAHHETKEQLKEAQHKIELHLNHMNSETKDVPSKLWRRIGSSSGRRSSAEMDLVNIKLRKLAVDVLEWNHEEAKFALEGKLLYTQPTDNNWRKGRTIKLSPVNALLVINGKPSARNDRTEENGLIFSRHSGIRDAALLLVRDKNGRYSLLREPLYLDRCVIAADPAWQSYFEVQELLGKDTFIFKAEDEDQTNTWYRQLQYHAQGMGAWRKRRNALANIMINGMGLRS